MPSPRPSSARTLKTKACKDNPVARSYALGQQFALQGTPAILLADGELLSGYEPPDVLLKDLQAGRQGDDRPALAAGAGAR